MKFLLTRYLRFAVFACINHDLKNTRRNPKHFSTKFQPDDSLNDHVSKGGAFFKILHKSSNTAYFFTSSNLTKISSVTVMLKVSKSWERTAKIMSCKNRESLLAFPRCFCFFINFNVSCSADFGRFDLEQSFLLTKSARKLRISSSLHDFC